MENNPKKWIDFVAHYYSDANFAKEANQNPEKALRDSGINIPDNVEVKLHRNTKDTIHLTLPLVSQDMEMEELRTLHAATSPNSACCGSI